MNKRILAVCKSIKEGEATGSVAVAMLIVAIIFATSSMYYFVRG